MKIILLFAIIVMLFLSITTTDVLAKIDDKKEILIASWNMCDFSGGGPCGNRSHITSVLENMTAIMTGSNYKNPGEQYDIIFVQELKNATTNHDEFTGFELLCSERYLGALGYSCKNTEWMGNTSTGGNNEGYGVIFKDGFNVKVSWTENNEPFILQGKETEDHLVRPPMKAIVTVGDDQYKFVVYSNHMASHKKWTPLEFEILQNEINYQSGEVHKGNILVLGDLNASCTYFKGGFEAHPDLFPKDDWYHIFSDDTITNSDQNTVCFEISEPN